MQSISLAIYERLQAARTLFENRLERTDRGQTALEYVGLLILVAAIIAVLFTSGIVAGVTSAVTNFVSNVLGGSPT